MNIVAVIVCYLIGSINFAYLVAKYKKINIQEIGSGNPGSSNVLRALGRNYAIVVLLGDLREYCHFSFLEYKQRVLFMALWLW